MGPIQEIDNTIQLTKHGVEYARVIGEEKGGFPEFQDVLDIKMPWVFHNYKDIMNDVTIPEALSYIYCKYPEMAKGSKTYEKLKPDIKEHIIAMHVKEKFSFGRAGELLGMPKHLIMDELAKRGLLCFGN